MVTSTYRLELQPSQAERSANAIPKQFAGNS
nr:MAG TPA: hypothetical protein [Caudoviricetes sp.]